jgi:hypothetical protein
MTKVVARDPRQLEFTDPDFVAGASGLVAEITRERERHARGATVVDYYLGDGVWTAHLSRTMSSASFKVNRGETAVFSGSVSTEFGWGKATQIQMLREKYPDASLGNTLSLDFDRFGVAEMSGADMRLTETILSDVASGLGRENVMYADSFTNREDAERTRDFLAAVGFEQYTFKTDPAYTQVVMLKRTFYSLSGGKPPKDREMPKKRPKEAT